LKNPRLLGSIKYVEPSMTINSKKFIF